MTVITSTNTFSYDLLERCAALQRTLDAIRFAFPRAWEPIGNNKFPGFYNHIQRVENDPTQGLPLRRRIYTVEMRLIVGQLNAGYKGENEDAGNEVLDMILDLFDSRRRLELAPTGGLTKVVMALLQPIDGGVQPFDYTDIASGGTSPPLFYLGIPFLLDVTADHNVARRVQG